MNKITMEDVARAAGVSKATVSYVLNRSNTISEEVRKKVLEAVNRLNYHPSGRRNLPRRKFIALLVRGDFQTSCEPAFSFHHEILARGYIPQIFMCGDSVKSEENILGAIGYDRNIAGVINITPAIQSWDLLKYCKEIPSFIYARNKSMLCSVECNYPQRINLAIAHLYALKHRKIVFFVDSATLDKPAMIENLAVLQNCSEKLGIETRIITHPEHRDNAALFPKLDEAQHNGFSAVLAWNSFFASMIYQWAYARQIRIPDEFSILAFCDEFSAASFAPPLTSVQIPIKLLVRYTLDALLAQIENRKSEKIILQPFLSPGESTAEALNFH